MSQDQRRTAAAGAAALVFGFAVGAVGATALAGSSSDPLAVACSAPTTATPTDGMVGVDVHCDVGLPAPETVTQTVTSTVTAQPSTTTPAPTATTAVPTTTGPTITVPPTSTPTTTAGQITHGRQVNDSNTGLNRSGVARASLVSSGGFTASTAGQVITGKFITGKVVIRANNVTLRNSVVQVAGAGAVQIEVFGNNFTLENSIVQGSSAYQCVWVEGGSGHKIVGNDISGCENDVSLNDSGAVTIDSNWLHGASGSGHKDTIEVYAGRNVEILRNRIEHPRFTETAAINVAPWSGASSVDGLRVADNFIDGGHMHIVLDKQSTGVMQNLRFYRNDFGGHTTKNVGGWYWAVNVSKGVSGYVQTEAEQASAPTKVVWPESGPNVNRWADAPDLSPNRGGQVVTWAVGAR